MGCVTREPGEIRCLDTSTVITGADPSNSARPFSSTWGRIGDFSVLGLWTTVVGFILPYHEKWGDEANAWLIARDLDLKTIWLHELRYEGTPGLWHTILWIAQHAFHMRYDSIGLIGAVCALAGVVLLIFKSPFPRYLRWPLAFTYFMVYQYAVIARQYTLQPLLCFTAATLFRNRDHPEHMALVLVLLANTSFHGTLLAGCFGLAYFVEALGSWGMFDSHIRTRYWIFIGVLTLTFVFLFVVLKPPPDSLDVGKKLGLFRLPAMVNKQGQPITATTRFGSVISGAFLDFFIPSAIFLLLSAVWSFLRGRLLLFTLPVALEIAFYSFVHGAVHHQGMVFLAALTSLWIAWPQEAELPSFSMFERRATHVIAGLLLCLCAVNIWDSVVVIEREYRYPYSGSEDAARYLKAVGADRQTVFGFGWVCSVEAYFDHNIMTNIPTSYTHSGQPAYGFVIDPIQLQLLKPEYVVVDSRDPEDMLKRDGPAWARLGYRLAHFSDGYYLFKRTVYEREAFLIFRRIRSDGYE